MQSKIQAAAVQIAWRGTRAAKRCQLPDRLASAAYRQAHNASRSSSLQVPPGGTPLIARRTRFSSASVGRPSPGGTTHAARRTRTSCPCLPIPRLADSPRCQALYQYSNTPFGFPITNFQGSYILAPTALLTKCIATILIDLASHNVPAFLGIPYLKPYSLSRLT